MSAAMRTKLPLVLRKLPLVVGKPAKSGLVVTRTFTATTETTQNKYDFPWGWIVGLVTGATAVALGQHAERRTLVDQLQYQTQYAGALNTHYGWAIEQIADLNQRLGKLDVTNQALEAELTKTCIESGNAINDSTTRFAESLNTTRLLDNGLKLVTTQPDNYKSDLDAAQAELPEARTKVEQTQTSLLEAQATIQARTSHTNSNAEEAGFQASLEPSFQA